MRGKTRHNPWTGTQKEFTPHRYLRHARAISSHMALRSDSKEPPFASANDIIMVGIEPCRSQNREPSHTSSPPKSSSPRPAYVVEKKHSTMESVRVLPKRRGRHTRVTSSPDSHDLRTNAVLSTRKYPPSRISSNHYLPTLTIRAISHLHPTRYESSMVNFLFPYVSGTESLSAVDLGWRREACAQRAKQNVLRQGSRGPSTTNW